MSLYAVSLSELVVSLRKDNYDTECRKCANY